MSVSSAAWSRSVVCLGGMYRLMRCSAECWDRWIFVICSSVFLVLSVGGMEMGVKVMSLCM